MDAIATSSSKPSLPVRIRDLVLELTGAYRLIELARGNRVAMTAMVKSPSRLRMGCGVTLQRGAIIHCGGKSWCQYRGHVYLGKGVVVGPYCAVYGAGGIEIGDFVHLGPGVKLMSQSGLHDRHRLGSKPSYKLSPISIGDGTWLGAGAVILGGVRIGRCVNVAPNAVVATDVPDYAVVAGNPARVVMLNEVVE